MNKIEPEGFVTINVELGFLPDILTHYVFPYFQKIKTKEMVENGSDYLKANFKVWLNTVIVIIFPMYTYIKTNPYITLR